MRIPGVPRRRRPPVPEAAREGGFSLLELMIALSIFVILGVALVQLIARSFDFLSSGTTSSEVSDQIHLFQEQFTEDLRSVFVVPRTSGVRPDVRMLYRTIPWTVEVEDETSRRAQPKRVEVRVPVLAFVRTIAGEEKRRITRRAGTRPGAEAYLDLSDDERESRQGSLRPLGGLMEVLYAAVPEEGGDGSVWRIVRAIRSPIGGEGSLLDPASFRGPGDLEARHCVDLVTGVLHFDVRFWGPGTQEWDEERTAGSGGPYRTWDSTRGVLPASGDEAFPLAAGEDSLALPRDDVFPRRVRARLTLVPAGAGAVVARLTTGLPGREAAGGRSVALEVDPPTLVPARAALEAGSVYLRIGLEWIRCTRLDRGRFAVVGRGERSTPTLEHAPGSRVHYAPDWEVLVSIPAFREEPGGKGGLR